MENIDINPKELYDQLSVDRKPYEDRAETLAKYTIPSMFPSESANEQSSLEDSYGSRYVSTLIGALASDITLALLPPSGSSFKFEPNKDALAQITQGNTDARSKIMAELGSKQIEVNKELANQRIRDMMHPMVEAIISTQAVVCEKMKNKGIRFHSLRNFVVKLDSMGEPLKYVIREEIDPLEVPEGVDYEQYKDEDNVELYTMCIRDRDKWTVIQSIGSEVIGNESTYKLDELPYTYLGWTLQNGDSYHRPMAEKHLGTIIDYENINRVLVQGSIVAAKMIVLVNPLGTTEKSDIANSSNGAVVDGREEDIGTFKANKNYDFQIPAQKERDLKAELDRAFMSKHGASYEGRERVTATEVGVDAQSLDENKSGIYSILSAKFTKWLIKHLMRELKIKFNAVEVNVVTGLDALGRNIEARKLDNYMMRLSNLQLNRWVKEPELVTRYAAYEGIDGEGLIKTEKEIQAENKAQQDAMAQQQLMNSGADALGKNIAGGQ